MLVFLSFLLLGGALLYYKIQDYQMQTSRESYASSMENAVNNRGTRLQVYINDLRRNTRFLAHTPPVQAITHIIKEGDIDSFNGDSKAVWEERLQEIFKAFLQAKPNYFQLRYIGVADNGRELVRVQRVAGEIVIASENQKQMKGDHDYFINTLKLPQGEIYLSEITLNRDHGQIQLPSVLTIRASIPIFASDGSLFGMIVANLDIGSHLIEITKSFRSGVRGYVTNQAGYFLAYPDLDFHQSQLLHIDAKMPGLAWHEPKQQLGEFIDFDHYSEDVRVQAITTSNGLMYVAAGKIHYDLTHPERFLGLMYAFPNALIKKETQSLRSLFVFGLLALLLLFGSFMFVMLRWIFSPLVELTNGARVIAEGGRDVVLPKKATGEIGDLVDAFQHMLNGITTHEQKVKTLYDKLKKSEAYASHIIESTPQGIIVVDADGLMVRVNHVTMSMFGYTQAEMLGEPVEILIADSSIIGHAAKRQDYQSNKAAEPKVMGFGQDLTAKRKDGSTYSVEIGLSPMQLEDKSYVVATITDISEHQTFERELRIAATVFDSNEAMFVTDAKANILRVNDAFLQTTGYSREEVIGKNPRILQSGRHTQEFYKNMWKCITQDGGWQGEIWDRRKNGEIYPKWATISSVTDKTGQVINYVSIFSDITAIKEAQDKVLQLAYFDSLTGLPNRRRLIEQLEKTLADSARNQSFGGLLFIDLDNFKVINDTLGHDQGDLLLKEVAKRLATILREVDTVARLGGDEFVIVLHELGDSREEAMSGARQVGEKLVAILRDPYSLKGSPYNCTGSVGISLFHGHEMGVDEILSSADVAMYEAKRLGRNGLRFFDPAMQASLEQRSQLESDLRVALKENQFVLFFQKLVDFEGKTIGAEALIRWNHPKRGMVSPFEFIPVCEESGLMVPVGQWILREACKTLSQWQQHDQLSALKLSVNISMKEFMQEEFVDQTRQIIEESGVKSAHLELEITESMAHLKIEDLVAKLHLLRAMGMTIAMDDFGTGYSSLSYLKKLPLDVLKIDQSFVKDLGVTTSDETIVQTIIKVGETFGLNVIAEGVETKEQFTLLKKYGCRRFQGYYFSPPKPIEIFEREL
jgi:diguanylate cyclase (GGDEF)-like protein/PAS domain S-box-containing protein